MKIRKLEDPIYKWFGKTTKEGDALEYIKESMENWEKRTRGPIVIPTSGGFDSRLLNYFISDKKRICSFTYGLSDNQSESCEVVYAKALSKKLGIRWKEIHLRSFYRYISDWNELFGPSTNTHGMYHMEFYTKIRKILPTARHFLTGVLGESLAGKYCYYDIRHPDDLRKIGRTAMYSDSSYAFPRCRHEVKEQFFLDHRKEFKHPFFQTIWRLRLKLMLLSYLTRIPKHYGFSPWAPFLDKGIALRMTTISQNRRAHRKWQIDFFRKSNIHLQDIQLAYSHQNSLHDQAFSYLPLQPLNVQLLSEIIKPSYVQWINRNLEFRRVENCILPYEWKKLGFLQNRIKLFAERMIRMDFIRNINAYCTLKSLETVLIKRNMS